MPSNQHGTCCYSSRTVGGGTSHEPCTGPGEGVMRRACLPPGTNQFGAVQQRQFRSWPHSSPGQGGMTRALTSAESRWERWVGPPGTRATERPGGQPYVGALRSGREPGERLPGLAGGWGTWTLGPVWAIWPGSWVLVIVSVELFPSQRALNTAARGGECRGGTDRPAGRS